MNDSKRLLTFINKHLSLCPPVKLSPLSKILLGKIAYQMELGETSWKTNESYRHEILTEFPKGEHYDGLVGEVRTEIETMQKIGKKYSFSIGDREFSIYILYPFDSRKSAKAIYATLDAYVTKIYIWLFVANHFSENHCSRSVSIYIFLTNMKKVLPSTPEPIDSIPSIVLALQYKLNGGVPLFIIALTVPSEPNPQSVEYKLKSTCD